MRICFPCCADCGACASPFGAGRGRQARLISTVRPGCIWACWGLHSQLSVLDIGVLDIKCWSGAPEEFEAGVPCDVVNPDCPQDLPETPGARRQGVHYVHIEADPKSWSTTRPDGHRGP